MKDNLYTIMPREKFNELYHYGVKGMKWGVRKKYQPVGRRPNITGTATPNSVYRRGNGLNSGAVGGKTTGRPVNKPYVSNEYLQELAYNSQSNVYPKPTTNKPKPSQKPIESVINGFVKGIKATAFRTIQAGSRFVKKLFGR